MFIQTRICTRNTNDKYEASFDYGKLLGIDDDPNEVTYFVVFGFNSKYLEILFRGSK